jgi:hypothetical protein
MHLKRTCRLFSKKQVVLFIVCVSVILVIWATKRLHNSLIDEDLEVVVVRKRVQELRKELQLQVDSAVVRSELRSTLSHDEEDYEIQIREDEAKKVPGMGDEGVAVTLQGEEAKRAEGLMKVEAFNILLSDKIPYSRTLPDARNPK